MAQIDSATVVVIGGGVTGLSSAWWLARNGIDVIVVERGLVGAEASGRNGGQTMHLHSPFGMEEQRLWPVLDEMLGYPTEWQSGRLDAAFDETTLASQKNAIGPEIEKGFEVEFLDGDQVRDLVPLANKRIVGGTYRHYGGHANPQRTVQAYAWAIQDLGGRIYQHHKVIGVLIAGGQITGVETDQGNFTADFVVNAAGPSTGMIAEMAGVYLPLAYGRVEQIVTEPLPPSFSGNFIGNGLYGRQTRRGNLAYGGGPHEWINVTNMSEPEKQATPLMRNLARRLLHLYAEAGNFRVIRSWSGIVELTPDHEPVIELMDRPRNFIVATMSGMGFGLSPAVGKAVSDLVIRGEVSFTDVTDFNVGRFADLPADWRESRGWVPSSTKEQETPLSNPSCTTEDN